MSSKGPRSRAERGSREYGRSHGAQPVGLDERHCGFVVGAGAFFVLAAAMLLTSSGCGQSQQAELLLYCGAGIRPPVDEIAKEFQRRWGVPVHCDYMGSELLLGRIKLSGQGDLYMPGDVHYVDQAAKEGLIASKKTVCYFVPVILVRKGNPKSIKTLADLTRPGVKVGLGDAKACAIGRKSSKIFAKNKIAEEDVKVEFRSLTVNELGNHVKLGMIDAAIVWDALAAYTADQTEAVAIPPAENVISTVAVGVLSSSEHPELARKFVDFVTSQTGQEIFRKHHYTTHAPAE